MAAIDVSYRVRGEGPPLYLVHGIGSRKTTWDELVEGLEDRFTCVSYDLRGHGDSPIPPVPYTLDQLVDDLEALRANAGSLESLKRLMRCGCRPCAAQIRCTVITPSPTAFAMARAVQWVAS